jgi:hypothetical protein
MAVGVRMWMLHVGGVGREENSSCRAAGEVAAVMLLKKT